MELTYTQQIAMETIKGFHKKFGDAHFYFALHCAFPSALTPDLLYSIRDSFFYQKEDNILHFPWISVGDILLSSLCTSIGHDTYEMDIEIRKILLNHLKDDENLGFKRLKELSTYLLNYIEPEKYTSNEFKRVLNQSQRRMALIHFEPETVLDEVRKELTDLRENLVEAELDDVNNYYDFYQCNKLLDFFLHQIDDKSIVEYEFLFHYSQIMAEWASNNIQSACDLCQVFEIVNDISFEELGLYIPSVIKEKKKHFDTKEKEEQEDIEKYISLIANSGIQFLKFKIKLDPNSDVTSPIGFWERVDLVNEKIKLEYAVFLPDEEMWVSKEQLLKENYLNENGELLEGINVNILTPLDEETEVFTINDILLALDCFENKWIPIPYFGYSLNKQFQFGPTNWSRLKLIPNKTKNRIKEYVAILIFDTKSALESDLNESPEILSNMESKEFRLCNNLTFLLNYCNPENGYSWVDEYLADITRDGRAQKTDEFPSLKYIALYIYFIKYFDKLDVFPSIKLFSDESRNAIDVNLVLDLGKSKTCGILFESVSDRRSFEFNRITKLQLQDLSSPDKAYDEAFSMQLAFYKNSFGEIGFQSTTFRWPSFVRIGKEAQRLINMSLMTNSSHNKETKTHSSNPITYLWDDKEAEDQWELIQIDEHDGYNNTDIYINGISEQLKADGTFTGEMDFGFSAHYSRKSLMTFVFIEILAQALIQINSYEFRTHHSNFTRPRRLKRVVITSPPSMVQQEQIALRQCAEEASAMLNRFFSNTYKIEFELDAVKDRIDIIPSIKDLKKDLTLSGTRRDWMYDQGTCSQLVFLYSEISRRYLNGIEKYFDTYGKKRIDLDSYDEKSITVGSIDIGAGSTDLMINAYTYENQGVAVLTPIPLYWESFNQSGNDFLRRLIQEIIIEGEIKEEKYNGCTGVIENFARERNMSKIVEKLHQYFGDARSSLKMRQMRKEFNQQISIPIAKKYINHAQEEGRDMLVNFNDLFPQHKPSIKILNHFKNHFGFNFQDIKWKLSAGRVDEIAAITFAPLIKQISLLLHLKACDFVLLNGRLTSLNAIEDLFVKYYPVSPDRLIPLSTFRVGSWYPFSSPTGYFMDHKSGIAAVGAAIALMGGKLDKLSGFRLNMENIKNSLVSNAEYLGIYNSATANIDNIFISPDSNRGLINIASLPLEIGYKQLSADSYPAKRIYTLDFDDERILHQVRKRLSEIKKDKLHNEVDNYKTNLKNRMPFTLKIARNYIQNKETLMIESITDKERNSLPKSLFQLKLKTLDGSINNWLDTGVFIFNFRSRS